jgi:UDP-N-acetylglucosamine 3-dehydrogenase
MSINVAVLGCGSWGRNHARVYNDLETANLVAVVDLDGDRAREIGKKFGVDWYSDPEDVYSNPEIDAISICTPTITHAECGLRAIEAGKHVLVEKPMTNTLEEAEKLIEAAYEQGVKLTVGFIERFNPAVQKAMEFIAEDKIGDVILAHSKRVSRWPKRIGDVGVIKDLAIHDIDVVNVLFGNRVVSVFATAGRIQHSFEDYANIMISYPDNKGAFVETNWLTPRKVRTLDITGTMGIIHIEYITQTIMVENEVQMYQPFIENEEPLKTELSSFVDCILEDEAPCVSGEDGLNALRICEAALLSAKHGEPYVFDEPVVKVAT